MIQSIVSTDDAVLYLDVIQSVFHTHSQQAQSQNLILVILLHPNDRVYIVDLSALGGNGGIGGKTAGLFDMRQDFALVQLEATVGRNDLARRRSLEVGKLPSLRGILESPSVGKVVFNAGTAASSLSRQYSVLLRGVTDLQLTELAGRSPAIPSRLAFHRKFIATCPPLPPPPRCRAMLRDLRMCLE